MKCDDPLEIEHLNHQWSDYVKSDRLKHVFVFPGEVTAFIGALRFVTGEDNSEYIYDMGYYYDTGMSDHIPHYKYNITVNRQPYELSKLTFYNTWYVDSTQFKDFFHLKTDQEKMLCDLFNKFLFFDRLETVRLENRLNMYKARFQGAIMLRDIIIKDKDFYLVLDDGTQAKISYVPD